eukprot:610671-Rhodomonas_salina.1
MGVRGEQRGAEEREHVCCTEIAYGAVWCAVQRITKRGKGRRRRREVGEEGEEAGERGGGRESGASPPPALLRTLSLSQSLPLSAPRSW